MLLQGLFAHCGLVFALQLALAVVCSQSHTHTKSANCKTQQEELMSSCTAPHVDNVHLLPVDRFGIVI